MAVEGVVMVDILPLQKMLGKNGREGVRQSRREGFLVSHLDGVRVHDFDVLNVLVVGPVGGIYGRVGINLVGKKNIIGGKFHPVVEFHALAEVVGYGFSVFGNFPAFRQAGFKFHVLVVSEEAAEHQGDNIPAGAFVHQGRAKGFRVADGGFHNHVTVNRRAVLGVDFWVFFGTTGEYGDGE